MVLLAEPMALRTLHTAVAAPHFGLLAQALMHGALHLSGPIFDGVFYRGRTYLPFGPLPAVLLIPAVAAFGSGVPVLWLGVVAVVASGFGFWALWQSLGITTAADRAWLTLASVGGTAALSATVVNSGYFVAHLVVIACLTWALKLALEGRAAWLCGVLVGLAALTRTNAVFAVVAMALIYWDRTSKPREIVALLLPVGFAVAVLALYNMARFGNPLTSGYELQNLVNPVLVSLRAQGLFSFSHLPLNLYYLLLAPPRALGGAWPWLEPSPWGMGLLFVSPWVLAALWARGRDARWLALGFGLVVMPSLLYYGIGWIQFGYRYALDGLPFLAALAAIGYRRRGFTLLPALCVASVAVNLAGADWLLRTLGA